jgi:hypothetical protein
VGRPDSSREEVIFGGGRRTLAAAVGMTVAVIGLFAADTAHATTIAKSDQVPVMRPQFRELSSAASWMWAGSCYVLAGFPVHGVDNQSVTLIDDRTGRHATIGRAGCEAIQPSIAEPINLPSILFRCSVLGTPPALELYSPSSGQWQRAASHAEHDAARSRQPTK